MRFLVDEDLPRSLTRLLASAGHEAHDVRDFSHPPDSHAGIVIVHFPNEVSTGVLSNLVLRAIESLGEGEIAGNLVMIEPGRIRIRRARTV